MTVDGGPAPVADAGTLPDGGSNADAASTDPCAPSPCQNGGACWSMGTLSMCVCTSGYTGMRCETAPPVAENGFGTDGLFLVDFERGNDRGRDVVALPDDSLVFVGSAAPTAAADIDVMVVRTSGRGVPLAGFGTNGVTTTDLGYNDEALFDAAHSASANVVAAVGYVQSPKPATMTGTDTDSLVYVLPTTAGAAPILRRVELSADFADRLHAVAFGRVGTTTYVYAAGFRATGAAGTSNTEMLLARFGLDGMLDMTFGPADTGFVTVDLSTVRGVTGGNLEQARGLAVQSDGRVLIAGELESPSPNNPRDTDIAVVRFTTDGVLDTSFGADFGNDGTKDGFAVLSFGVGLETTRDAIWSMDVDTMDRALLFGTRAAFTTTGGVAGPPSSNTNRVVARVLADGSGFDPSFNATTTTTDGGTTTTGGIYALGIGSLGMQQRQGFVEPDGKILSDGYVSYPTGVGTVSQNVIVLLRLLPNGTPDPTFGVNGVVVSMPFARPQPMPWGMAEAYASARLQNGDYVTAGYGFVMPTTMGVDLVAFRYKADGARYVTSGRP